jgi:serine/threonine protein kinase
MAQLKNPLAERAVAYGLISAADVERGRAELGAEADDARLLEWLVKQGLLTKWQAAQLEAGRTQNLILAHYRLLAPLGAGGMGSVYRAFDPNLNRQVALKVLPPRQATPEAISRFRREAFVALQMRHDNVVTSFELAQHGTIHFLVMELIDGRSLSAHLARQRRLSVRETARIGYDVALALEHAHEQGIIHRDIKPSNILLSREGHVKVADMGLAKFFGPQTQSGGPETRTGQFMGTIDYCSPEQAVDAKRADIRSDIYSLGCTLYHCLTGEPPFAEGTEVQRIMAHIEMLPASIRLKNRDVPPAFAELIEKRMLAKDPGDRFQTPAEAAEALASWVRGKGGSSANLWAGLESLDSLLEVAAQAPRVDLPPAAPQSRRDTARRPRSPVTRRAITLRAQSKHESVLWRPLGWAAAVLVILATATAASLWWPRRKVDDAAVVANLDLGVNSQGGSRGEPSEPPESDETNVSSSPADHSVDPPSIDPPQIDDAIQNNVPPTLPPSPAPSDDPALGDSDVDKPSVPQERKVPGLVVTVKHPRSITCVAVSADGSILVTGGSDKKALAWNAADGTTRGAALTHNAQVASLGLSADGRYAVTRSGFGFRPLITYKQPRGRPIPPFRAQETESRVSLWDISGGGSKSSLTSKEALTVSADGKFALSLECDNSSGTALIRRYELPSGAPRDVRRLAPPNSNDVLYPVVFSPDLRRLAAGASRRVWLWDAGTGKFLGKPRRFPEQTMINEICFQPDSRSVAVTTCEYADAGRRDGNRQYTHSNPHVHVFDLSSDRSPRSFKLDERLGTAPHVAFHPSRNLLALIGRGELELRDTQTGEILRRATTIDGATAAAFSGDGKRLLVGKSNGTAELWELDALLGTLNE